MSHESKSTDASIQTVGSFSKFRTYWQFARPFTLVAPALGMVSGGITALGAKPEMAPTWEHAVFIVTGAFMAAALNTASNTLNQIFDLEIDRINKPNRPLCTGALSVREAWAFSLVFYALSLALAWPLNPPGAHRACFILVVIAAVLTYLYSAPPARTKRFGVLANITIAIPRGMLLKMAGWSAVRPLVGTEPWFIGMIFGIFLLGATTTKDFADIRGDARSGCMTLPVRYGVRKAAWITCPFFVFPFLLLPLGAETGILTGNRIGLDILGVVMALWGLYVARLILRDPDKLATDANHVSWTHMYLMMFLLQIGFAAVYWI